MRDRLPIILSTTASLVALFGATPLGHAAYNAAVPRNSVGTPQLRRNAVTSSKIAPNTVRTGQVVDGSLLSADFKSGQIPQGPKGDKGDKGSKGDPGPVGISGYEIVSASATVNANTTLVAIQAKCPSGKKVLGGSADTGGFDESNVFHGTSFVDAATGASGDNTYQDIVTNKNTTSRVVTVKAVCGKVGG